MTSASILGAEEFLPRIPNCSKLPLRDRESQCVTVKRPYLGMLLGGFMQDQGVTVWYRRSPRVLESHPLMSLVTSQGGCLNVLEE